jgi:CRP-like cAMP-binding protein
MKQQEILNILVSLIPLKDLSDKELTALAKVVVPDNAQAGQYITKEGSKGDGIIILFEGKAKVCKAGERGKQSIIALFGRGGIFGEMSLLTGASRSASLLAVNNCKFFRLSPEDFSKHIKNYSGFSMAIMRSLAVRLRVTSQKLLELSVHDLPTRLIRTLTSMAVPCETMKGMAMQVRERPRHKDLADLLGCTREAVTRAFKTLEEAGVILVEGQQVFIAEWGRRGENNG